VQRQQGSTFLQDRQHYYSEQIEFQLGNRRQHYMQQGRYFLHNRILQGKLWYSWSIQQGKKYRQGTTCKQQH